MDNELELMASAERAEIASFIDFLAETWKKPVCFNHPRALREIAEMIRSSEHRKLLGEKK